MRLGTKCTAPQEAKLISTIDGMVGRDGRSQAEGHRHLQSVCVGSWVAQKLIAAPPRFSYNSCTPFPCRLFTPTGMSPYRQRPFKGVFQSYLLNGFNRIMAQVPYWIVPVGIGAFRSGKSCCLRADDSKRTARTLGATPSKSFANTASVELTMVGTHTTIPSRAITRWR